MAVPNAQHGLSAAASSTTGNATKFNGQTPDFYPSAAKLPGPSEGRFTAGSVPHLGSIWGISAPFPQHTHASEWYSYLPAYRFGGIVASPLRHVRLLVDGAISDRVKSLFCRRLATSSS